MGNCYSIDHIAKDHIHSGSRFTAHKHKKAISCRKRYKRKQLLCLSSKMNIQYQNEKSRVCNK